MHKKNRLSTYLMHKVVTENTLYPSKDEVRILNYKVSLRDAAGKGDTDANKRLANREYYEKHRAEKKAYNEEYYRNNAEYWVKWRENAEKIRNARARYARDAENEMAKARNLVGENSDRYKKAKASYEAQVDALHRNEADLERAKMNEQQSYQDLKWYMDSHRSKPVSDLWSSGARSVVDAGKSFISSYKSGLNSIASSISSGLSKFKSLFS